MNLIGLLILLIVFCVVYWAATRIMAAFGVGEPVNTIVIVVLVLLFLFALAGQLGYGPGLSLG